jgi:phytoene desaturase
MLHMRPHNRFEDLERTYLVGGGTHPGSGLPVIYSSARITADLLLEDLGVAGNRQGRGTTRPGQRTGEPAAV